MKKSNTQTVGRYPSNSLYNWQTFNRKKLEVRRNIMLSIIEDQVTLYDMFWALNDFINFNNEDKDNTFKVEEKLNGLSKLFIVGMIHITDHQDHLFEVMHNTIHETRALSKTIKERAEIIEKLLRMEVLNLLE